MWPADHPRASQSITEHPRACKAACQSMPSGTPRVPLEDATNACPKCTRVLSNAPRTAPAK
ncbi:hypothetical protein M885DRAFT_527665 [Pelagophyceae sp. CCMP2097]|nr:hypothetical protein M885DRAFT_527665 [Pelagophyceae sp. CCMP2097]